MREAGFLFYFLFPQKQMRDAGLLFYFLKDRRGMYLHEPLYSPTMFHGRCTTCTAPDDIWTDTRAMLDMNSDDFLEKKALHNIMMEDAIIKKDATLVYLH